MLACRNRDTAPEWAIRRALHSMGFRYRVAARPLSELRRTADLVFRSAMVVVFVDGCFWHQCPLHFKMPQTNTHYWEKKISRNVERDRTMDEALLAAGWKSIRIWEHEDSLTAALRIAAAVAGEGLAARLDGNPVDAITAGQSIHRQAQGVATPLGSRSPGPADGQEIAKTFP